MANCYGRSAPERYFLETSKLFSYFGGIDFVIKKNITNRKGHSNLRGHATTDAGIGCPRIEESQTSILKLLKGGCHRDFIARKSASHVIVHADEPGEAG